jgi:EpsI family protein
MKTAAALVLVVFGLAGNYLRISEAPEAGSLGLDGVSLRAPDRQILQDYREEQLDDGFLETLRAREVVFRTYETGAGDAVWLFMGYFDRQKEGSQVHSPKHCYPGSGWNIVDERTVEAPWGDGSVHSLVVSDGFERRLVYYWFQTSGGYMSGVLPLKLYLKKNAVMRKPQDVVFIRISTISDSGRRNAEERLGPYAIAVRDEVETLYTLRNETN